MDIMQQQQCDSLGRRLRWSAPVLTALFLMGAGCASHTTRARYDRGLVVVVPGIEGEGIFNWEIVHGLDNAGVPYALEIDDWTTGIAPLFLYHLMDHKRCLAEARTVAERIERYARWHEGKPLWIVAQSGGGGIAVLALDAMAEDCQVDGVVLIAPGIGREYNLAKALRRVRTKIYHYYSRSDVFFLGAGTTVFGNIDRTHGKSAGRHGFIVPDGLPDEDKAMYKSKLEQFDCSSRKVTKGTSHIGLHLTSSDPRFIEKVVAPRIWKGKE